MGSLPFIVIAMSATLTPRIEIYTILACRLLRPDIYHGESMNLMFTFAPTRNQLCAADPVVQAAVAKVATGVLLLSLSLRIIFDVSILRCCSNDSNDGCSRLPDCWLVDCCEYISPFGLQFCDKLKHSFPIDMAGIV